MEYFPVINTQEADKISIVLSIVFLKHTSKNTDRNKQLFTVSGSTIFSWWGFHQKIIHLIDQSVEY